MSSEMVNDAEEPMLSGLRKPATGNSSSGMRGRVARSGGVKSGLPEGFTLSACSMGTADVELVAGCLRVAERSPEYFSRDEIERMRRGLPGNGELYFVADHGHVVGFAALWRRSGMVAEISWLAVAPEHRKRGIGPALIREVSETLRSAGVALLEVKTLAQEAGYAPYEGTRRFYERQGFLHLETVEPYPGWEPGNPCAIYVKVL